MHSINAGWAINFVRFHLKKIYQIVFLQLPFNLRPKLLLTQRHVFCDCLKPFNIKLKMRSLFRNFEILLTFPLFLINSVTRFIPAGCFNINRSSYKQITSNRTHYPLQTVRRNIILHIPSVFWFTLH